MIELLTETLKITESLINLLRNDSGGLLALVGGDDLPENNENLITGLKTLIA